MTGTLRQGRLAGQAGALEEQSALQAYQILNRRVRSLGPGFNRPVIEYKVRWAGRWAHSRYDTWEPAKNLAGTHASLALVRGYDAANPPVRKPLPQHESAPPTSIATPGSVAKSAAPEMEEMEELDTFPFEIGDEVMVRGVLGGGAEGWKSDICKFLGHLPAAGEIVVGFGPLQDRYTIPKAAVVLTKVCPPLNNSDPRCPSRVDASSRTSNKAGLDKCERESGDALRDASPSASTLPHERSMSGTDSHEELTSNKQQLQRRLRRTLSGLGGRLKLIQAFNCADTEQAGLVSKTVLSKMIDALG
eukprot:SAG31_NODE_7551_length_1657_cov_2.351733_1_plen_303_part_10